MFQTNAIIRSSFILAAMLAVPGTGMAAPLGEIASRVAQSSQKPDVPVAQKTNSPEPTKNDPYAINKKPKVAEGIGVDSMIGEMLVMDIPFHDERNRKILLGDYFDGKRPVMLSFNYSDCPKLCSVQLENMTSTLRQVAKRFKVKDDFQIVSISIDPLEQASRSRQTKEKYTGQYNQPGTEDGWHFLTGKQSDIELIADICGFRYKYIQKQKLYSHPPVFILISPKGKIVRYIHGLKYDSDTIEQALVESAEGRIGSPINILNYGLGCFLYNESTGKYTFQAMAAIQIGGAITIFVLLVTLVPYWFFQRGASSKSTADKKPEPPRVQPTGTSG